MLFKKYKKSKLVKILSSENLLWSILFLVILQVIMAFSNVWLANLGASGANGLAKDVLYYFGLYVSSLFVANIPEAASNYQLSKAKLRAVKNYVNEFVLTHQNAPALTLESRIREEREPWLTGESEKTLDESLTMIHGSMSMTLGSIFTIGTLAVVIDPKLIIGYSLSLVSMPFLLKFFKKPLEESALRAQRNRKSFSQVLLSGWENITIGNEYNTKIWWKQFLTRIKSAMRSTGRFVVITNLSI